MSNEKQNFSKMHKIKGDNMKDLKPIPIKPTFEILKDNRVLKALAKRYNFEFDKKYHYITTLPKKTYFIYKGKGYKLKYYSGCFNPYIVKAYN